MWVRFYDNVNIYRRKCWGEKRFDRLEDALDCGLRFRKVNDNYYSARCTSGIMVKVLREPDA